MKINNKGYASTIIMFSILTLFLISMLMLVKTMNNSSSLNKKITEKVVDNINYDASGTMQDRLTALENTVLNLQNQLSNTEKNIITKIYPVGSIYMSTEDDTIEKVQKRFGGTWEVYASGRTLVSAGTYTDSKGNIVTYKAGETGGNASASNIDINHTHTYDKTSSGTYNTVISHSHSTNDFKLTIYNLPMATIIFANVSQDYSSVNNAAKWSTGLWNNYGAGYAAVPLYMTSNSYGQSINIGNTNSTGSSTGSVSMQYSSSNTSDMSSNSKIDAKDPYIVTYIYKRVK